MNNNIIVRVAEGLGNQMFMYANAYSLAARNQCTLLIDDESGFYKKRNRNRGRSYNLDSFLIETEIVSNKFKFNTTAKDILRKFLKIINFFLKKKIFIIEKCFKNKKTKFVNLFNFKLNKICYVEGHFESEKYFLNYSNEIKEKFTININKVNANNFFISKLKSVNSVSIHFRKHRFAEEINEKKKNYKIFKTNEFETLTLDYINNGIRYFKKNVLNPVFFLWSNDFNGLENQFSKDIVFIKNQNLIEDFNLFSFCQHFIVGPSTFHWWGAWLNKNPKKICLRPKNVLLNPSNNFDFWPDRWIPI
jgi:hypothetical protein